MRDTLKELVGHAVPKPVARSTRSAHVNVILPKVNSLKCYRRSSWLNSPARSWFPFAPVPVSRANINPHAIQLVETGKPITMILDKDRLIRPIVDRPIEDNEFFLQPRRRDRDEAVFSLCDCHKTRTAAINAWLCNQFARLQCPRCLLLSAQQFEEHNDDDCNSGGNGQAAITFPGCCWLIVFNRDVRHGRARWGAFKSSERHQVNECFILPKHAHWRQSRRLTRHLRCPFTERPDQWPRCPHL